MQMGSRKIGGEKKRQMREEREGEGMLCIKDDQTASMMVYWWREEDVVDFAKKKQRLPNASLTNGYRIL
jgi:hypothetical protein